MNNSITKEVLASLKELKEIIEIAVSGKDGLQFSYLETRRGSFIAVTDSLIRAEAAIAKIKPPADPLDTRSTFSGAADYDQTTPFNGIDGDTA